MDGHLCYFRVLLYKCNVKVKIFGKHVLANLCESPLKSFLRSAVFETKGMHAQFYTMLPHGSPECIPELCTELCLPTPSSVLHGSVPVNNTRVLSVSVFRFNLPVRVRLSSHVHSMSFSHECPLPIFCWVVFFLMICYPSVVSCFCVCTQSVFLGPAKPLLQFLWCGMGPGSFLASLDLVHGALCLFVLMGSCPLQREVGGPLAETFACFPDRLPSDSWAQCEQLSASSALGVTEAGPPLGSLWLPPDNARCDPCPASLLKSSPKCSELGPLIPQALPLLFDLSLI